MFFFSSKRQASNFGAIVVVNKMSQNDKLLRKKYIGVWRRLSVHIKEMITMFSVIVSV